MFYNLGEIEAKHIRQNTNIKKEWLETSSSYYYY